MHGHQCCQVMHCCCPWFNKHRTTALHSSTLSSSSPPPSQQMVVTSTSPAPSAAAPQGMRPPTFGLWARTARGSPSLQGRAGQPGQLSSGRQDLSQSSAGSIHQGGRRQPRLAGRPAIASSLPVPCSSQHRGNKQGLGSSCAAFNCSSACCYSPSHQGPPPRTRTPAARSAPSTPPCRG